MAQKKHEFYVRALWDDEVSVYYSRSNIKGLHIEADTLEEFQELVKEFAPELILNNHFTQEYLQKVSEETSKPSARTRKTPVRVQAPKKPTATFSFLPPVAEDTLLQTA